MGDIALRGNKLTRKDVKKHFEEVRKAFPKDFAPGGRYGKRKDFKTHGKDIPTMAAKGGRIGFKQGGAYGPLRGTTAGGVAKAFRGKAGFKESQALQKKILKGSLVGPSRATGPIKSKGKVIGTRIAKAGSKKAMGNPRAPMTKGDYAMKNFKKRIQKTPNKPFREDKTYKLYTGPGKTKTHGKIISGKAQKKKIIQQQIDIKRKWEAKGDKWGPYKGGWKAKGGKV